MYHATLQQKAAQNLAGHQARLSKTGKLFIVILLIAVMEGAFRKWVSAEFTVPLVLLRDVLALYGVAVGVSKAGPRLRGLSMQLLLIWSALVVCWGLLQLIVNQSPLVVFFIGLRFWLLYFWFASMAAASLTEHDFRMIAKTVLILLLLMVPLAVVQHFQPPGAFLNVQVDGDEEKVFRVTADIVRTTGTFSFTLGYTVFMALVSPFAFALFAPGLRLWKYRAIPVVCLACLGVGSLVSGSRGAIIFFCLMFCIFTFASLMFSKGVANKRSAVIMVLLAAAMLSTLPFIFSRAVDASQERFESAAQIESVQARIGSMFLGEPGIYKNLPLMGYGLGGGSNFAAVVATGKRAFLLAETETARTILEGGLLGIAFIVLKLFVILFGLAKSLSMARRTENILPIMLWATTAVALLSWSIIGQLTVNAFGSLLFGLALASLRLPLRQDRTARIA